MKRTLVLFVMILSFGLLSSQTRIEYVSSSSVPSHGKTSENTVIREIMLRPFKSVDINYFLGDVVIRQGTRHEVTVTADDHVIDHIQVLVKDDKLYICMEDKNISYNKAKIKVEVDVPHLEEVTIQNVGDVTIEKRAEVNLSIVLNGTGDCVLQSQQIENSLELFNHGVGDIVVPTSSVIKTGSLLIHNSGTGDVSLHACQCSAGSVVINNAGVGDVFVNMMKNGVGELALQNKGTGTLKVQNINVKQLELKNLGSGDMVLNGIAESIRIVNVGTGDVSAQYLKAMKAHITNYGTSTIKANVSDTAYITNYSAVGKVDVSGGAKLVWE
ncbi:MAG: DUF2807 domain-containing protein [Bacteroidales bacterium]|nr:DUF2807 domain-containing protein [Bacteroidales bacterium]